MRHRIALDAMGGDGAPLVPVQGAAEALREWPDAVEILLVGQPEALESLLEAEDVSGLRIIPASETVEMNEPPALAIRRKRDSSIAVGLGLVRSGEADAFISAGSTGAVMAGSLLFLRPLPGVERPPVGTIFPTSSGQTLVLDAGANVNCRPGHLQQFAHLGSVYMRDIVDIERPRVGLLNLGTEPGKGDELRVTAYRLLREDSGLNFVGNIEGDQIIRGACDVLVCDGFVGNVLLKFYESMAGFVTGVLGQAERPLTSGGLDEIFRFLDYAEYGGAPLLGVNGVSIICHGGSPPRAIRNAIGVAMRCVRFHMVSDMAAALALLAGTVTDA